MILALITRLFTGEAGIYFARLRRMAGLYALMALFALGMVIFLLTALFIWLAQIFGSLPTALGFAAAFLLLLLATYLLTLLGQRKPADRDEDRLQRDIASIAGVAALANAPQLVRAVRSKRGLIAVPVIAASFYGLYRVILAMRGR